METTLNESNIYSQLLPINYRDVEKEIENDFILGRKVMNYVGTINLKHIWGEENWKKSIFSSRQTNKDFPRMIIPVIVLRMGIYVPYTIIRYNHYVLSIVHLHHQVDVMIHET